MTVARRRFMPTSVARLWYGPSDAFMRVRPRPHPDPLAARPRGDGAGHAAPPRAPLRTVAGEAGSLSRGRAAALVPGQRAGARDTAVGDRARSRATRGGG